MTDQDHAAAFSRLSFAISRLTDVLDYADEAERKRIKEVIAALDAIRSKPCPGGDAT
jgi:hypothetical protein